MRCPQCGVEQPLGVTVCGFCGALMVRGAPALRSEDAEALARGAAQASRAARGVGRWMLLVAAAAVVGLFAGWIAYRGAAQPSPGGAHRTPLDGGEATVSAPAPPAATPPSDASQVVRGAPAVRFDDEQLRRFAEELADAAARGDARELAVRVDARARYRLRVDDRRQARELNGGKAELLAHWLAPWLVDELFGLASGEAIEIERVAVDIDLQRGMVARRIDSVGDVSRLRFPRALLEPLALRGALDLELAGRVDLSPLRVAPATCTSLETIRIAGGPAGPRVVEVERVGRCAPPP